MALTAYPAPRRVSADRIKRIEDELIGGGTGGGGGPATNAQTPLCSGGGPCDLPASGNEITINPTSFSVAVGEEYWGTPGSALPLAMTLDEAGRLAYPASIDDAVFDIETRVNFYSLPADAGDTFAVAVYGNAGGATGLCRIAANGVGRAVLTWTDRIFIGDTPAAIRVEVDGLGLLDAAGSISLTHTVAQC